jgi:phytoene synthase
LGAIRLAWWRERLDELDAGAPPPAEPRLRAIARQLVGRGITGRELAELEDAWLPLLQPFPWDETQADGLKLRGRVLFGIGARLLGGNPRQAEAAGELWSLANGASHCSDAKSTELLLNHARTLIPEPDRVPKDLRPLTVLAAIAAYDLSSGRGRVGRVAAALAHRTRGTFPRRS